MAGCPSHRQPRWKILDSDYELANLFLFNSLVQALGKAWFHSYWQQGEWLTPWSLNHYTTCYSTGNHPNTKFQTWRARNRGANEAVLYCPHYNSLVLPTLQQTCIAHTTTVLHCPNYNSLVLPTLQQCLSDNNFCTSNNNCKNILMAKFREKIKSIRELQRANQVQWLKESDKTPAEDISPLTQWMQCSRQCLPSTQPRNHVRTLDNIRNNLYFFKGFGYG